MPTYEYQCTTCGHALEAFQRMSDAQLTDCPACGKPTLEKKISASGFQLKGTGWYETDFKGKTKKKTDTETTVDSKSTDKSATPDTPVATDTKPKPNPGEGV
ncbi:MAG: zinc ribbon domain-containing protein [Pseudomonadota bacterium]